MRTDNLALPAGLAPVAPLATLARWLEVARERRALARLDDRTLADLGLDPAAARAEAARPFWDLPRGR